MMASAGGMLPATAGAALRASDAFDTALFCPHNISNDNKQHDSHNRKNEQIFHIGCSFQKTYFFRLYSAARLLSAFLIK